MASAGLPSESTPQPALPEAAPPPSKPPKSHLHHHDDVWNEESTLALLQAWGKKFIELNHGFLSRGEWSNIAQLVSSSGKSSKTETQCRNRIDTLKKKYKREKHKMVTMGGSPSSWPYFKHMDGYLNPTLLTPTNPAIPSATPMHAAIPVSTTTAGIIAGVGNVGHFESCPENDVKHSHVTPNNAPLECVDPTAEKIETRVHDVPNVTANDAHDAANMVSASCEPSANSETSGSSLGSSDNERRGKSKRRRMEGGSFRIVAKALKVFAGVYERIELAKQQQARDLEKSRMEIMKKFELQKWRLYLQTQLELAKIKAGSDQVDPVVDDATANLFATWFMPFEYGSQ